MKSSSKKALNCEKVNELIYAYVKNELTEEESSLVKEHLEHCEKCRDETQKAELMLECLADSQYNPGNRIYDGVMKQIGENKKPKLSISKMARFASVAAIFAISIGIALVMGKNLNSNINEDSFFTDDTPKKYMTANDINKQNGNEECYDGSGGMDCDSYELECKNEKTEIQAEDEVKNIVSGEPSVSVEIVEEMANEISKNDDNAEDLLMLNYHSVLYDENGNYNDETISPENTGDDYLFIGQSVAEIYSSADYVIDVYRDDENDKWVAIVSQDGKEIAVLEYDNDYQLISNQKMQ